MRILLSALLALSAAPSLAQNTATPANAPSLATQRANYQAMRQRAEARKPAEQAYWARLRAAKAKEKAGWAAYQAKVAARRAAAVNTVH